MAIRIGGLASGMDIDTLVSDLMKAERMPLDKMYQKKQTLEWQRDDYREMNKLLKELDTQIFDGVFRQSSFTKKAITSSDETKVTAKSVSATANTSATVEVSQLASAASWSSNNLAGFTSAARTLTFEVQDPGATSSRTVTIELDADDTIDDLVTKINSSSLGMTAMKESIYDAGSGTYKDTFVLTSNKTGSGGYIKAGDAATKTFMQNDLGFTAWNGSDPDILDPSTAGQNAVVKINGYQMEKTSNTFTVNGMSYTVKNTTTSPVTVSSTTDVDSILDTVVQFVNKYNEVIEKINGELTEERYRDYAPLTDEQKEAMTETQVELWEEKARSGLLRNDSILSGGLNQMRLDFYSTVNNSDVISGFQQLADIGITTSSNYLDRGKLIIDETKLREKIEENPDAIYKLFMANGSTFEEKGIARRLRDTIKNTIGKVEEKAGNTLSTNQQFTIGRNLTDLEKQIDRFEDRLIQIEDRYWSQFTAMETAIQRMNEQSMYLMQQFGGF
ncbi:flagellar hook-associated protein 2 [Bacillus kexueae]|uniref:flagellar hook-associated protein 2 n=1 Tax=Aeribacillus kexueae TaxID=2078952 RepID=UPI001FAF701A|nr:flagellar hook-associated protein 2 [Bacillus kexueae]